MRVQPGPPGCRGPPTSGRVSALAWIPILVAAALLPYAQLLTCPGDCAIDLLSAQGKFFASLNNADFRLNAWILASAQNNLLTLSPLFEANALFPSSLALAGSEHLYGLALPFLPLAYLLGDAWLVANMVLVASSLILTFTTFALVRWVVGSDRLALLVSIGVASFEWRVAEIGHLQLESAFWIPAVWLLWMRALHGKRKAVEYCLLGLLLFLQLMSSYYVAYMLTISLAVIAAVYMLFGKTRRSYLLRTTVVSSAAYAFFVAFSAPYLLRRSAGQLEGSEPVVRSLADTASAAVRYLVSAPDAVFGAGPAFRYTIPAGLVLLALCSARVFVRRDEAASQDHPLRAAVAAMWGTVAVAFVLMLGSVVSVGETMVTLPAGWLAVVLPGFDNMRAPMRWGLLVSFRRSGARRRRCKRTPRLVAIIANQRRGRGASRPGRDRRIGTHDRSLARAAGGCCTVAVRCTGCARSTLGGTPAGTTRRSSLVAGYRDLRGLRHAGDAFRVTARKAVAQRFHGLSAALFSSLAKGRGGGSGRRVRNSVFGSL